MLKPPPKLKQMRLNHKRLRIKNEEIAAKKAVTEKLPNSTHEFSILLNIQQRQIDLLRERMNDLEEKVSKLTR